MRNGPPCFYQGDFTGVVKCVASSHTLNFAMKKLFPAQSAASQEASISEPPCFAGAGPFRHRRALHHATCRRTSATLGTLLLSTIRINTSAWLMFGEGSL